MPNYHFKCLECGHKDQKLLPVAHEAQKCLECGHPEMQKMLTAPGVQFKSGGFYKTDSHSSGGANSGPSGGVDGGGKDETKTANYSKEN